MDRVSDSVQRVLDSADQSSDIHDIIESARAALLNAEAVSLFGLQTPHPDFGSVHWIVGRTDTSDGEYLVLGIPEHSDQTGDDGASWQLFSAGANDLGEAFRALPPGFVDMPEAIEFSSERELVTA